MGILISEEPGNFWAREAPVSWKIFGVCILVIVKLNKNLKSNFFVRIKIQRWAEFSNP